MTQAKKIAILTEWKDCITESDQIITDCLEPLMLSPESPLYQAMWSLQGAYTKATAVIVGDHCEWLDWFASENDMGAHEREASPGTSHPMRKIKTIADLAQLIEESQ